MKRIVILIVMLVFCIQLQAQKYMTQNGVISFFSRTPVEDIEAINNQVSSVINGENGEIAAVLLMKAFSFEKALMQEHFNEKYVESDKFPKAVFKGQIIDFDALQLNDVPQKITIQGELTIHGVTNNITVDGTMSQKEAGMDLFSEFEVAVADYDIKIPKTVRDNIAETVKVTIKFGLNKL